MKNYYEIWKITTVLEPYKDWFTFFFHLTIEQKVFQFAINGPKQNRISEYRIRNHCILSELSSLRYTVILTVNNMIVTPDTDTPKLIIVYLHMAYLNLMRKHKTQIIRSETCTQPVGSCVLLK